MLLTTLLSCNVMQKTNQSEAVATETEINYLAGYFLKNDVDFKTETKYLVLTNRNDFDQYFGIAKTMNNTISEIDFEISNVAALIYKASYTPIEISLINEVSANEVLHFQYKTTIQEKQSFSSTSMKLFTIPKTIKSVVFTSGKETNTVSVVN
jgi:hypothetical protein